MSGAQHSRNTAEEIIEEQLDERLATIGQLRKSDALAFSAKLYYGIDDIVRDVVEAITPRKKNLTIVLETTGGYIEVVERMVHTVRRHYRHVEYVIPSHAMSAGTVLVMSGNRIWMDYYSILGPIDPQVRRQEKGPFLPALGYLAQYEKLIEKSRNGELTDAELAYFLSHFDPGELYRFQKEKDLSESLLEDWISRYKFKNWKTTEDRGLKVTRKMKEVRAGEIAKQLNNTEKWHSHERGISMEILRKELNLKIDDFGEDEALNEAVRGYHKLASSYMSRIGIDAYVHSKEKFRKVSQGEGV